MKVFLFICCCLPMALVAQKELLVNCKIEGLKDLSKVYLVDANDPNDTIAKGIQKKGEFTAEYDGCHYPFKSCSTCWRLLPPDNTHNNSLSMRIFPHVIIESRCAFVVFLCNFSYNV